ncbi:MAG TPA: cofactor-independent phosphoglycerate mutase [Clostridiales bacterium]|nr:cofactor-independent phosphoglycerate mutase [Clostridiales bacterium]
MKYIVVLGDGMSDYPIEELDNKTPLQYAHTPAMDYLAQRGSIGMVKTIPDDMPPGSDTANLSVLGYDPKKYYSGRSPFEAASMGIEMGDDDISFRCNLVTLSDDPNYEDKTMIDHSSDEISSQEAVELIKDVNRLLGNDVIKFYPGVSYRHVMIWNDGPYKWQLTPPHDILGQRIGGYMPRGEGSQTISSMMKKSVEFLDNHPINRQRRARGLKPANSIWVWGEGKRPRLPSFFDKYGVKGSVISAVDLIKGIGLCAGLKPLDVEGATGNIHTNYSGKAQAALDALLKDGQDFVYIHVEAPDECGHRHEIQNKVKSIELIDKEIIGRIIAEMDKAGVQYKIMVLPDHPTPLSIRTHTREAVPFLIYRSGHEKIKPGQVYDEAAAQRSGLVIEEGYRLMDCFLKDKNYEEV